MAETPAAWEEVMDMAAVRDMMTELEGIWFATRKAQRRRRTVFALQAGAALVSGACLTLALYAIYAALAGV
jgi:hypothetical protein